MACWRLMLSGPAEDPDDLVAGVYEEFVTERIRDRVEALVHQRQARTQAVDPAEQARLLGDYVGDVVARALEAVPVPRRTEAVNQLLLVAAALVPPGIEFDIAPL